MHLFYAPHIGDNTHILSEEESKHAVKVLRLGVNSSIVLVDGQGTWCEASISEANPKKCVLQINKKTSLTSPRSFKLIVAVAPTKNIARMEWFLEKATELGIDTIIPLMADHSERIRIKAERWEKVLVSAMKQSLKAHVPALTEPMKLAQVFTTYPHAQHAIAHCRAGDKTHLISIKPVQKEIILYIGPEGDFSEREISFALEKGAVPITLGEARLRTETAALAACHIANLWKHV